MADIKPRTSHKLNGVLGDVRRTNNFVLNINGVSDNTDIDLVIQAAFLPKVSLDVLELRQGNDAIKLAGVATWQGGSITVRDVINNTVLDSLLAWFKQTYDPETGTIGYAADYKKNGMISEFAANGEFIRRWTVKGLWISEFNFGELDASRGDLKQVQLTLQIDPPSKLGPDYLDYR